MEDQQKARRIAVLDTTLRDGEQAPGNALNAEQKLEMAMRIADLGVDTVEAGFPASSPSDFEATQLIAKNLAGSGVKISTFSRTTRHDVELAIEAGGPDNHDVQLVATASDIHLKHKRGMSREQAIHEVIDSVAFAKSLGASYITVGLEDATRGSDDLLRALIDNAAEAGVTTVVLADTTGCLLPQEYAALVTKVRGWVGTSVKIGTHCHNDFGLSTINAIAGVQAGADEIQVTLGGIGERAGNTPMEEIVALLTYKTEQLGLYTDIKTEDMYAAYTRLREMIKLEEPRNKPIFGTYAFCTAAGIHQQGMISNPVTYEFVEPSRFGRERSMVLSRHSGRTVLRYLLSQLGITVDENRLAELYRVHVAERTGGDAEDLELVKQRLAKELLPEHAAR
jgi:2-isopropylmalate synthase